MYRLNNPETSAPTLKKTESEIIDSLRKLYNKRYAQNELDYELEFMPLSINNITLKKINELSFKSYASSDMDLLLSQLNNIF